MQAMNVSTLSTLTAKTLGLSNKEMKRVGMDALFHNIGMSRTPPAIRLKSEGDMSLSENQPPKDYPQLGKEMLEAILGMSPEVIEVVSQHRDWLDGTGYPKRLTMETLPRPPGWSGP